MANQNAVTPMADSEADHFAGSPRADSAVDHFVVLPPEGSVAVQVYSQAVDSQEVVSCPGPTRLLASKTRGKTELPVISSA